MCNSFTCNTYRNGDTNKIFYFTNICFNIFIRLIHKIPLILIWKSQCILIGKIRQIKFICCNVRIRIKVVN